MKFFSGICSSISEKFQNCVRNKYFLFCFSICITFTLLVLPDVFFSFYKESFIVCNSFENICSIIFIILASFFFLINKYKIISAVLLTFFTIIQLIQFSHIKYFGVLASSASLYLLTKEVTDVVEESVSVFWNYAFIFPLIIIPYIVIYKISHSKFLEFYKPKNKYGMFYTISVFIFVIVFLFFSREEKGPNPVNFSLENSIRTFAGYVDLIFKHHNFPNYKSYSIEQIKNINEPTTIVYILGESTNPDHMSLFGYHEDTTPELNKLAQSDNFFYTIGIAGGVTTISSSKFMCNAIREPDNAKEASLDTVNLFRLAKLNGFKTFYISSKTSGMLSYVGGVPYMDVLIAKEQYPTQFSKKRDSFLFELIAEQKFSDKNFVVIHQRCIHAPYKKTVPRFFVPLKRFTEDENATINEYDTAVLYNDSVVAGLFNIFNKFEGKFYIFWSSDHNELMGENGLWGHSILNPVTARVPILIQSNDKQFIKSMKEIFSITHHDICRTIAELLGFKIINPNEKGKEDIYYINGVDFLGRCGYIPFRKDYKNKKIEYLY